MNEIIQIIIIIQIIQWHISFCALRSSTLELHPFTFPWLKSFFPIKHDGHMQENLKKKKKSFVAKCSLRSLNNSLCMNRSIVFIYVRIYKTINKCLYKFYISLRDPHWDLLLVFDAIIFPFENIYKYRHNTHLYVYTKESSTAILRTN